MKYKFDFIFSACGEQNIEALLINSLLCDLTTYSYIIMLKLLLFSLQQTEYPIVVKNWGYIHD